jgi:hypothetical protein
MTMSFLNYHFCMFLDAWHDGRLKKTRVDDISFNLDQCVAEEEVAAIYCIINDLDNDDVPGLVKMYHEYRAEHPTRPIPDNVVLGDN